jgi:hypothetical protein
MVFSLEIRSGWNKWVIGVMPGAVMILDLVVAPDPVGPDGSTHEYPLVFREAIGAIGRKKLVVMRMMFQDAEDSCALLFCQLEPSETGRDHVASVVP